MQGSKNSDCDDIIINRQDSKFRIKEETKEFIEECVSFQSIREIDKKNISGCGMERDDLT